MILSWDCFRSFRNLLEVCFGLLDFSRSFIAFWRSGSVGLIARICFAAFLFGCRR